MFKGKNITEIVHDIVKPYTCNAQVAIDATAGNGFDTLFLANELKTNGNVYSFDIQDKAIENTKALLEENMISNVTLIQDDHSNVDKYEIHKIDIAMYNLGYLPKADKTIITKPYTTVESIKIVANRMRKDGIITVVCYIGHEGGKEEKESVGQFLKSLDNSILVSEIVFVNRKNSSPHIYIVEF